MTTSVLLIGAHGYGARHLENLERLQDRAELIGVVDPKGAPTGSFGSGVPYWSSLDTAFADGIHPDVVIIATPTGTHFALASLALEHGCDLYLEKPPVASMEQFERLLALQEATGRAIQIGFQSFGSHALTELARLGVPTSVATWGAWVRNQAYWTRSAWAGKRTTPDGQPIVDGVATNPLSHAVATALRIAGARRREDIRRVELQLMRANDIEADDTSAIRVVLSDGRVVSAGLTLCAAETIDPVIEVRTPAVDAELAYIEDRLRIGDTETVLGRDDLFEELLDHRETGRALSAALIDTGAYMAVLETVRLTEPTPIDPTAIIRVGDGAQSHVVVDDVAAWCARAARAGALFSELHTPWAPAPQTPSTIEIASVDDVIIAVRDDGATVTATSSPRPHLHPLRTLAGVQVTDAHPVDHDWHLGVNLGIQNVNDVNFWGGRTYTRGTGYRWLADHGVSRTTEFTRSGDGFTAEVEWVAPDGVVLLRDFRRFTASLAVDRSAWMFILDWTLTAAVDVALGSPGTAGRVGAGYGGLSWRLPAASEIAVSSGDLRGEGSVHGSTSDDPLVIAARFADGEATIALVAMDASTRADRWFVRVEAFPSIGSALAWDHPLTLRAEEATTRRFAGIVADGILSPAAISELLAGIGARA